MKLLILILFTCFTLSANAQFPKGLPSPYSNGFSQIGYSKTDSGMILPNRDTSWTPRFSGTLVRWKHAGVDTALWVWDGRWSKYGTPQSQLDAALASLTFSNGLTRTGNVTTLEGSLTKNTSIVTGPYSFSLTNFLWDGERFQFAQTTNTLNQLIGHDAGYNHPGNNLQAWGTSSLIDGSGNDKIAIGIRALRQHLGNQSIGVGSYTLQNTNGDNNNAVGFAAGSTSYTTHSNFFGTGTNAGVIVDSITLNNSNILVQQVGGSYTSSKIGGLSAFISSLGLVTTDNRYFNVVFSGTPPLVNDGLGRRAFYEEKGQVTSSDTIQLYMGKFQDQGTGTMKIYGYSFTSNATVIGDTTRADKSNQAVLGNSLTTQLKSGKIRINTSTLPTDKQVLSFNSSANEYQPASLLNTSVPTLTPTVNAGTGATAVLDYGNSTRGVIIFKAGSDPLSGTVGIVSVVFGTPYTTTPVVIVAPGDNPTWAIQPFVPSSSTTGFNIIARGGIAADTYYTISYIVSR